MPIAPDRLLVFVLTSLVFVVVPGPTVMTVVGQALAYGRRVALASVFGVALGNLLAASLSLVGIGTILAASARASDVVTWCGAAYLVQIGLRMWWAPARNFSVETDRETELVAMGCVFRDAFLVTLFNPKSIVFFMGFVPQFISATRAFAPQAGFLVGTFVLLSIANAYCYAVAASGAREMIRRPAVLRAFTRTGASFLIATALASVFTRGAAI